MPLITVTVTLALTYEFCLQCENIVEDLEDDIMEIFAVQDAKNSDVELCGKR